MNDKKLTTKELLKIIKKNLIPILIVSMFISSISYFVSEYIVTPKYTASVSMIINNKNSSSEKLVASELDANKKLVTTYSDILKTRGVVNDVINKLKLDMEYEDLRESMNVYSENNNEVFTLTVEDTNPERAADIANQTSVVFKDIIQKIMNLDNVQILDKAIVPDKKSSPSTMLNIALTGLISFVLLLSIKVIKEILDTSIKNSEQLTDYFDLPVIGIIPDKKQG